MCCGIYVIFNISLYLLMYTMGNETRTTKFDNDFLSTSYRDGIERVIGLKDPIPLELPEGTIKKRQSYWDQFFFKYLEEPPQEEEFDLVLLKPCKNQNGPTITCKSKNDIQYWINTGYLPYQTSIRGSNSLRNNHGIKKKLGISYVAPYSDKSSLSSSVDTAAYILSNINTTNKIKTMAIVEGAKHNNSSNPYNTIYCDDMEIMQAATDKVCHGNTKGNTDNKSSGNCQQDSPIQVASDKIYDSSTESNTNNNNNNGYQQHSPIISEIMTCTLQQQNTCPKKNADTLDQEVNANSISVGNVKSYSNNLSNDVTKPVHSEQNGLEESVLTGNSTKIKQRKKLYTGRDSPVDLVSIKHTSKQMLCKLDQNLHPALDVTYPLQRKLQIHKKRSRKHSHTLNKDLMNTQLIPNHTKLDEIEKSQNYFNNLLLKINSLKDFNDILRNNKNLNTSSQIENVNTSAETENLNKCNNNQFISQSVNKNKRRTVKTPVRTEFKYNKKNKRNNAKICNKSINSSEEVENLNPIVELTRLSEPVIMKYEKKANELMSVLRNLHPVVSLTKLSNFDIQLNPVVYLPKLSKSEIQKYKRSTNLMRDANNLNSIMNLKALSDGTVQNCTTTHNMKTHNESDLLFETVQLPDNSVKSCELPLRTTSNYSHSSVNVINITSNDTDSDESTVLIYKCSNKISSASNVSSFSKGTIEVCSDKDSRTNKRNKNTVLRKDVSNKRNIDDALNMSNSPKHVPHSVSLDKSRIMLQDRCNDNVQISNNKKLKFHFVVCSSDTESELVNLEHRRKRTKKITVAKNQTSKAENYNKIGNTNSRKLTVARSATKQLHKTKDKKDNSKHNINYLHFETNLYESSSDSEILSSSSK